MRRLREERPARKASGHCDRCGQALDRHTLGRFDPDPVRFAFQGGYGSCFGDGWWCEGEFCWNCIHQLYDPYLHLQGQPLELPEGMTDAPPHIHRMLPNGQMEDHRPPVVIECDRCGRSIDRQEENEWQEAFTIRYESVDPKSMFPGPIMEADFCQYCVMATIGPWLRVLQEYASMQKLRPRERPRWAYQQIQLAADWPRRHELEDEA
ncbi:MAG TPA: hypothetical protein VFQ88_14335 [Nevskiaceae bacterium]|nr:hypothetical protein [Nevskiaceae bacterium]